jgi:sialate O-acetylesterase
MYHNEGMKSSMAPLGLLGLLMSLPLAVQAELKLPAIFGENMVWQSRKALPVWGWAAPGAAVTVTFAGDTESTHATADGAWRVTLGKFPASFTPQTLVVSAGDTLTLTNILVGEVWLASGQSNMEKPIGKQPGQIPCFNAEQELAAAEYPNIRIFQVEKMLSATPRADLSKYHGWQPCSSNALNSISFSAAAYFFGREIHTNLSVPVGLIESSWGGTRIEPWTPPVGFAAIPSLAGLAATVIPTNRIPNTAPTVLYNAMIAPLAGFALRGALWYQGESNLGDTNYDVKMAALIGGWRQVWHEGDFPFYFVQIAPYLYHKNQADYSLDHDPLPGFWVQQSRAARRIKHTGMVVTTDLVDDLTNIHPRDKQSVGHRLALLALDETYEQEVASESPAFSKLKIKGATAVLKFKHAEGGLASKDGQPLTWFTIAGADGVFVPAEAKIVGQTVVVSAPGVPQPAAVRFAWGQAAQPNLVNRAGLPA